jgi:hypothetical protein
MRKTGILMLSAMMLLFAGGDAFAQRASVSGKEVTGTFKMNFRGKFAKHSNDMKIQALGGGKLRVAFDLIYPYTLRSGEVSVNMGFMDTEASIIGDTAVIESEEFGTCRITIKFVRPGTVRVTQEGSSPECGFGHNVTADGTYRKVSSKRPKFEDPQ